MSEPNCQPEASPALQPRSALQPPFFRCVLQRSARDMVRLRVTGELDIAAAETLGSYLEAALAGARVVVLDLRQVDFIDCTGLSMIIAAHDLALHSNRRLMIRGSGPVDRLVRLTGLAERLDFADRAPSSTTLSS